MSLNEIRNFYCCRLSNLNESMWLIMRYFHSLVVGTASVISSENLGGLQAYFSADLFEHD